jgi:hypothetical protein
MDINKNIPKSCDEFTANNFVILNIPLIYLIYWQANPSPKQHRPCEKAYQRP